MMDFLIIFFKVRNFIMLLTKFHLLVLARCLSNKNQRSEQVMHRSNNVLQCALGTPHNLYWNPISLTQVSNKKVHFFHGLIANNDLTLAPVTYCPTFRLLSISHKVNLWMCVFITALLITFLEAILRPVSLAAFWRYQCASGFSYCYDDWRF